MSKKKAELIFLGVVILFMGSLLCRNLSTYDSLKKHPGYTLGIIVKVWDDDDGWYCRYQYVVDGKIFLGRQGKRRKLQDTVLIVYDVTKPRFSVIANYSSGIIVDSSNKIIHLDTSLVHYKWSDYLPGDEIHSVKDVWSLD